MSVHTPQDARSRPSRALPFVVRRAKSPADLEKVARLRATAYGRHLPDLGTQLQRVEHADRDPHAVVLLAEAKEDGRAVGTVRLRVDRHGPLTIEASVALPRWMCDAGPVLEPNRLAVEARELGTPARNALLKATYLHALAAGVQWVVVAARWPIDRLYESFLFSDVFAPGVLVPMRHCENMPHRVMALSMPDVPRLAIEKGHPMAAAFFDTDHPDLIVDATPLLAPMAAAA